MNEISSDLSEFRSVLWCYCCAASHLWNLSDSDPASRVHYNDVMCLTRNGVLKCLHHPKSRKTVTNEGLHKSLPKMNLLVIALLSDMVDPRVLNGDYFSPYFTKAIQYAPEKWLSVRRNMQISNLIVIVSNMRIQTRLSSGFTDKAYCKILSQTKMHYWDVLTKSHGFISRCRPVWCFFRRLVMT